MITYDGIKSANERVSRVEVRKGKFYADVAGRVQAFRELCPNGSIIPEIVTLNGDMCVMKATAMDEEGKVLAVGHAYERETSSQINRTSYIENCETSAVGRCLGLIGIGSEHSMATAEEMENALQQQEEIDGLRSEILKLANGNAARVDNFIAARSVNAKKLDDLNLPELKLFRDLIKKSVESKEGK